MPKMPSRVAQLSLFDSEGGGEGTFCGRRDQRGVPVTRAKMCQSRANEEDLPESEVVCSSRQRELLGSFCLSGSSLRTSQGCFHRTKVRTSSSSSKRLPNSGMALPGEYWIASTSEWPSGAVVCSLSEGFIPATHKPGPCCRGILLPRGIGGLCD